jgi:hypothetical protein
MAWGAIAGVLAGVGTLIAMAALGMVSPWLVPGGIAWGVLVVLGFHDNIGRLLSGTEPKLGT